MRIEPVRLTRILKSLSSTKNSINEERAPSQQITNKSNAISTRDPGVLKGDMRNKLRALKQRSTNFLEEAPILTIQEIMAWEFGDQFLNHPDLKYITQSIVTAIGDSPKLSEHMNTLIKNLTHDSD